MKDGHFFKLTLDRMHNQTQNDIEGVNVAPRLMQSAYIQASDPQINYTTEFHIQNIVQAFQ
jgi:hypothetical protein